MLPLLQIAEGRKPRLRKAPPYRPKELVLHLAVAKLLHDWAKPDWQWTHIAHGEARDKRTAAKLKAMGTRPGWPDFILVPPTGKLHCLELKRIGGNLSDNQRDFCYWCNYHNIPYEICSTLDHVLTVLNQWGCLRVIIGERA